MSTRNGSNGRIPSPSALPMGASPRAAIGFLVLLLLLSGLAYPEAMTGVAGALTPHTANGSIEHSPNGTAFASGLLGENITNPDLFWLRPSLIDDAAFSGAGGEVPPGPTDPALVNETRHYIALYGLNGTVVPIDLVTPSASGLDPDVTPAGVLVQIARVSTHTGLPESFLLTLVNTHIHSPFLGVFGTAWVNVVALDVDLLTYLPPGTSYT